jgi:hypothetical protein
MTKVETKYNAFPDFHAGLFLREELAYSGHDSAWLAEQTGMTPAELERLFTLPDMDAMLFVRAGHPLGEHFLDHIHAIIFAKHKTETVN